MMELTDDLTDEQIKEGLTQRVDYAIDVQQAWEAAQREAKTLEQNAEEALENVGDWMDLLDDSLMSVSRRGYWLGYEETEPEIWNLVIKPVTPPDHLNLG